MLKLYVCTLFYNKTRDKRVKTIYVAMLCEVLINKVAIQLLLTRLLPVATTKLAVEVKLV